MTRAKLILVATLRVEIEQGEQESVACIEAAVKASGAKIVSRGYFS